MSTLREAAQQFVADYENGDLGDLKHYARALRAALAQQEAPKGGDGVTSQTAYVVMLNDSPEHVVIGDKDLAQMRMHELRERYWVRHQGTLESRKNYALRCRWYIREVDGEVAA
jgi:hypothetical protein